MSTHVLTQRRMSTRVPAHMCTYMCMCNTCVRAYLRTNLNTHVGVRMFAYMPMHMPHTQELLKIPKHCAEAELGLSVVFFKIVDVSEHA